MDYQKTWNVIKSTDNYEKLPSQVGQQTLKIADRNFKSFFTSKNKTMVKKEIKKPIGPLVKTANPEKTKNSKRGRSQYRRHHSRDPK